MPRDSGYGQYPIGMHFVTSQEQRAAIQKYARELGISVGEAVRRLLDAALSK